MSGQGFNVIGNRGSGQIPNKRIGYGDEERNCHLSSPLHGLLCHFNQVYTFLQEPTSLFFVTDKEIASHPVFENPDLRFPPWSALCPITIHSPLSLLPTVAFVTKRRVQVRPVVKTEWWRCWLVVPFCLLASLAAAAVSPPLLRGPWHCHPTPMPVLCRLSNWQQCQALPQTKLCHAAPNRAPGMYEGSVHLPLGWCKPTCLQAVTRPRPVSANLFCPIALECWRWEWHAQNMYTYVCIGVADRRPVWWVWNLTEWNTFEGALTAFQPLDSIGTLANTEKNFQQKIFFFINLSGLFHQPTCWCEAGNLSTSFPKFVVLYETLNLSINQFCSCRVGHF